MRFDRAIEFKILKMQAWARFRSGEQLFQLRLEVCGLDRDGQEPTDLQHRELLTATVDASLQNLQV